jgi:hypothetical protein
LRFGSFCWGNAEMAGEFEIHQRENWAHVDLGRRKMAKVRIASSRRAKAPT